MDAELQEVDYSNNGECDISRLDGYSSLLKIDAKLAGTNVTYTSTTPIVPGSVYPLIVNGWTRQQLDLTADTSRISEDLTDSRFVWNNDTNNITYYPTNTYTTTQGLFNANLFNDNFYVDLYLANNTNYQAKTKIKYDNETPVIYEEKTKIAASTSNDKWTNNKIVLVYATDKTGVGLDKIYVGTQNCSALETNREIGQPAIPGALQTYVYKEDASEAGITANICAVDKLGNITSGGTIVIKRIDATPPTCVSSGGSNSWTLTSRTLTGTCTDTGVGCKIESVSKNVTDEMDEMVSPGTIEDKVGNKTVCPEQKVRIDRTKPRITLVSSNGVESMNYYVNSTARITDNLSGVAEARGRWMHGSATVLTQRSDFYVNDGNVSNGSWNVFDANGNPSIKGVPANDGSWFLWLYAKDGAGNENIVRSNEYYVDPEPPVCVYETGCSSNWKSGHCVNTIKCTDNVGCQLFYNNENKGDSFSIIYGKANGLVFSQDLEYHDPAGIVARDAAGNETPCTQRLPVYIDNVAPVCYFTVDNATLGSNGWYKSPSVTVTLHAWDEQQNPLDAVSGLQNYYFDDTGTNNWSNGNMTQFSFNQDTWVWGNTYIAHIRDKAGNVGSGCTVNVKKDSTPPVCNPSVTHADGPYAGNPYALGNILTNTPSWTNTEVNFHHGCSDISSGLDVVAFTNGYVEQEGYTTDPQSLTYVGVSNFLGNFNGITGFGVRGCDKAGNCSTKNICAGCNQSAQGQAYENEWNSHIISIDRIAPTLWVEWTDGNQETAYHYAGTTGKFTCGENESGIATSSLRCIINGTETACGSYEDPNSKNIINYTLANTGSQYLVSFIHSCIDVAGNQTTTNWGAVVVPNGTPPQGGQIPSGDCNSTCDINTSIAWPLTGSEAAAACPGKYTEVSKLCPRPSFGCATEEPVSTTIIGGNIWIREFEQGVSCSQNSSGQFNVNSPKVGIQTPGSQVKYYNYLCNNSRRTTCPGTGRFYATNCSSSANYYRYYLSDQTVKTAKCTSYKTGSQYLQDLGSDSSRVFVCCK